MCENEQNMVDKTDFNCIGQVAAHCDNEKLCIAIGEAQEFDLSELFCGFWDTIVEIWEELEAYDAAVIACEEDPECTTPPTPPENLEEKRSLICGGEFTGCNDRTRRHMGVKRILVYYAYSRYIVINGFSDTASGMVRKTNEFSIPTPLKEMQSFADKYRTMGYESCKKTLSFLCINKEIFTTFDSNVCEPCGCGGKCDNSTKAKGYGIRSSTITKKLPNNGLRKDTLWY